MLGCNPSFFKTQTWSYSNEEFKLLTLSFFDRIYPTYQAPVDTKINIIEDKWNYAKNHSDDLFAWFINFETLGELATKLNLRNDHYYEGYISNNLRGLYDLFGDFYRRSHPIKDISETQITKYHKLKLNLTQAQLNIYTNSTLKLNEVIGSHSLGSITLYDIKNVISASEWKSLIASPNNDFNKVFIEKVTIYLNHFATQKLFSEKNIRLSLLNHIAHNIVADSYIQVKYHPITKGIYPVDPIAIKLDYTELFDYFHKYKLTLRGIKEIICSYAIFENEVDAQKFYNDQLQVSDSKDTFTKNILKYENTSILEKNINFKFRGTVNKASKDLDEDISENNNLRSTIINQIYIDGGSLTLTETLNGYLVFEVHNIKYDTSKKNPIFSEYRWFIENTLRTKILQKQLNIDLKDTQEKLNIQYDFNIFKNKFF